MAQGYRRQGLLRGTPPYPWWQWVLAGGAWAASMFVVFAIVTGFRHLGATAAVCAGGGVAWAVMTRALTALRERRRRRHRET